MGSSIEARHAFADLASPSRIPQARLRMHYVEAGEGPLLLLLHGFPETCWSWRHQMPALARAGFRVVAPDQRGYGETESSGPFDVTTLTEDALRLVDVLGAERFCLVGHDWGGGLAWQIASAAGPRCEKLVIVNAPHPAMFLRALARRPRQIARSWYIFYFALPWIPEWRLTANGGRNTIRAVQRLAVDRTHFSDAELAPYAEALCKPGRARAMIGWYRAMLRHRPGNPRAVRVACPTLLVWGLEDAALGFDDLVPGTEQFAPSMVVHPIAGAGHFVHEERPELVNELLTSFL